MITVKNFLITVKIGWLQVYMYYGLDNFYQNHRRYVKSRDDNQLQGKKDLDQFCTDCEPFDLNDDNVMYAPRGAIANSLFNGNFNPFN